MRAGSEDESAQHLRRLRPDQDGIAWGNGPLASRPKAKKSSSAQNRPPKRRQAEISSRNFIHEPADSGLLQPGSPSDVLGNARSFGLGHEATF